MAKIVVVEDDVYMREELLNLLEKSGYDTIGLSDFENAVSEIAAYFPDLILLELKIFFDVKKNRYSKGYLMEVVFYLTRIPLQFM